MQALHWLFAAMLVLAAYPIAGYPVVLFVLGKLRSRPVLWKPYTPAVTVLIPAYNEAGVISRTIENKLEQDYPPELLEIIVVSDGSDDGTDDVVRSYASKGVKLLSRTPRAGKAAALNAAVRMAQGEILVFSDANSLFDREAVRRLAENFADPTVGYVTGHLGMLHEDANVAGQGSGAYLRYESWLRELETRVGSVIGVNGGVDAMRKALYVDVPADQITDFVLPLHVIATGGRAVYDARARSSEEANDEVSSEFRMRVRVALRALRGLSYMKHVLNVWRYPLAAFCILSHKVLRYLSFVFLFAALLVNVALARDSGFYSGLLVLHLAAYAAALIGMSRSLPRFLRKITMLPTYFLLTNAAFAVATFRFLKGDTMSTWRPRAG